MRATNLLLISFFAATLTAPCLGDGIDLVRFVFSEEIGFGAGQGVGQFSSPTGLAIGDLDGDGWPEIFVADTGNNRVQRATFDPIRTQPADFEVVVGPASGLVAPKGLDVDTQRSLIFVADTGNNQVLVKDLRDGSIDGMDGTFNAPQGVAVCCGGGGGGGGGGTPDTPMPDLLFIADTGNNRIQRATFDPVSGDPNFDLLMGPGTALAQVSGPRSIMATPPVGHDPLNRPAFLFVADTGNNRIQRATFDPITFDPDFDLLMGPGSGLGEVMAPEAVAAIQARHGEYIGDVINFDIIVADTGNNRVQVGTGNGNNINWAFLGGGEVSMLAPGGLAVGDLTRDGRPDLVVADTGNNRLLLFVGVPEPSTLTLAGLIGVFVACRRRLNGHSGR